MHSTDDASLTEDRGQRIEDKVGDCVAMMLMKHLSGLCGRGPALGGPPTYRFSCTHVTGLFMRPYNVPNDRVLAPSAGGVEYK